MSFWVCVSKVCKSETRSLMNCGRSSVRELCQTSPSVVKIPGNSGQSPLLCFLAPSMPYSVPGSLSIPS